MPLIKIDSDLFGALEAAANLPQVTLDYQSALDTLINGDVGRTTVLQVSSTLIRIEQKFFETDDLGNTVKVPYELRLSGSGIGPVSSMDALIQAINAGLATGSLSKVAIRRDGVEVLSLSMSTAGYVLASGDQRVTFPGDLPLTFEQIFDLAGLFTQALAIDTLTNAQRNALFVNLSDYGVSGLTVADGAKVLFAAHVDADSASLTVNGLTISLSGTFPDNFGEDLSLLWDIWTATLSKSSLAALPLFGFADLTVTSLKITDGSGAVLARINNPMEDTPATYEVDGVARDYVHMGEFGADFLDDVGPRSSSTFAGLSGDDYILALGGNDQIFGGSGNDTLNGGRGGDAITGGSGDDVQTGGAGRDQFIFNLRDGHDVITDFEIGLDRIKMTAANALGDLSFTQVGTDVQIDHRSIHILVEDITVADLRVAGHFLF